ncbi:hypothetical protein NMY22_g4920 [Coprinellus aureogranulatus]|nr:hypothetical protein NMY22_g4920 [Coprinellus aureogranulatus]
MNGSAYERGIAINPQRWRQARILGLIAFLQTELMRYSRELRGAYFQYQDPNRDARARQAFRLLGLNVSLFDPPLRVPEGPRSPNPHHLPENPVIIASTPASGDEGSQEDFFTSPPTAPERDGLEEYYETDDDDIDYEEPLDPSDLADDPMLQFEPSFRF